MHPRRSFLSRIATAAAVFSVGGAKAFAGPPIGAQEGGPAGWQPARHPNDDWLDQIPGRHRLFFDTLSDAGLREARGFTNNYFDASRSGYGLEASDLAVIICLRHSATLFAYSDPFWAKYGSIMAESLKLADPKMTANPHRAPLDALGKRGVRYAVCEVASHRYAGMIARKVDITADAIYREMAANLIGNAHFVAAGIIAVNRAQERGYSIAYTG